MCVCVCSCDGQNSRHVLQDIPYINQFLMWLIYKYQILQQKSFFFRCITNLLNTWYVCHTNLLLNLETAVVIILSF